MVASEEDRREREGEAASDGERRGAVHQHWAQRHGGLILRTALKIRREHGTSSIQKPKNQAVGPSVPGYNNKQAFYSFIYLFIISCYLEEHSDNWKVFRC